MREEINFYLRKEEYGWLSNFWRSCQSDGLVDYSTNEHYYQAEKARDGDVRIWIREAPNAWLAMNAGRSLRKGKELRDDWNDIKVQVMLIGLRAKFMDEELREKLLATGDAIIHEDSPSDMFWGKKGEDMLGKLLMQVREELRKDGGTEK